MAGRIFVNYRRDDDPSAAARVRDGLAAKFGKSAIFMDVDNLLAGQRFDEELAKALAQCDVLIAIIGPRWMDILRQRAASGERDYVREEIAGALQRRIVVVPVRVGREGQLLSIPRADDLPADIRDLVHYQKHDVAHERFSRDIAELTSALVAVRRTRQAPRPWRWLAAGLAALAIVGVLVWLLPSLTGGDDERQRLEKLAAEAEQRREAAETAAARLKLEAEEQKKSREEAAEAERAAKQNTAEEERKAREAAAAEQQRKEQEAQAAASEAERRRQAVPTRPIIEWLTAPGYWAVSCSGSDGNIFKLNGREIEYLNPGPSGTHGYANFSVQGTDTVLLKYIKKRGDIVSDITQTIERLGDDAMKSTVLIDGTTTPFNLQRCGCGDLSSKAAKVCNRSG